MFPIWLKVLVLKMRDCSIDFNVASFNQLMSIVRTNFCHLLFQDLKIKLNGELLVYCKLVAQLEEKIKNLIVEKEASKKAYMERKAQYKRVVHYHKAECQKSSLSFSSRNSLASKLGFKKWFDPSSICNWSSLCLYTHI